MKGFRCPCMVVIALISLCSIRAHAGAGTEAASFLDIPVGGRPAAMGDAYAALADDAYAMTSNPGGLGLLKSTELAGQHLSYLESIHYEHLGFVHPLDAGSALGASMQYLGSGDIAQTDRTGSTIGQYSTHYAAYSLAYGRALSEHLGIGATVKMIDAKIADVSGRAFAVDVGGLCKVRQDLRVAAVLTNVGTKLKFLDEGGSLPLAFKMGAAYQLNNYFTMSLEGVYPKTGLASGHVGVEWKPLDAIAIRAGYRTDTTKELGAMAGLTTGLGIKVWGQELSYAWVPYGDLGNTQYFSFLARFGEDKAEKRNLIQFHALNEHGHARDREIVAQDPEYQQLMQLLADKDDVLVKGDSQRTEASR